MRIGILGTGNVGQALTKGFAALGHEVKIGSRSGNNEKATAFALQAGPNVSAGGFAEAAEFGELLVLATLGVAGESALAMAGPVRFRGKVVIDATNPLDPTGVTPPRLAFGAHDSAGERAQALLPEAHVVKAFNTVGHAMMFRPALPGGPPDMFIAGNSLAAKRVVGGLLTDFGWGVVDVGGIESSRYLEAMCMVWILSASWGNNWHQAFKLLRG